MQPNIVRNLIRGKNPQTQFKMVRNLIRGKNPHTKSQQEEQHSHL